LIRAFPACLYLLGIFLERIGDSLQQNFQGRHRASRIMAWACLRRSLGLIFFIEVRFLTEINSDGLWSLCCLRALRLRGASLTAWSFRGFTETFI
jgi:hypothetical protein